jgi:hypothetical protein
MTKAPAVYHFDEQTGAFLFAGTADKDPLEKDRWVLPAFATLTAPPAEQQGFARCFVDGAWGYVALAAPDEPTAEPVVTGEMVNAHRDMIIEGGTSVEIDGYGSVPLQGRDKDQRNLLGLVQSASLRIAAGDTASLTKFRDAVNVDHLLTPPQIVEMWSKASAWIESVYDASWALKAMDPIPLDYATNPEYWP